MFKKPDVEQDEIRNKLQRDEDMKNSSQLVKSYQKPYKVDQYTNYKPINENEYPGSDAADKEKPAPQAPRAEPSLAAKNFLPSSPGQKHKDEDKKALATGKPAAAAPAQTDAKKLEEVKHENEMNQKLKAEHEKQKETAAKADSDKKRAQQALVTEQAKKQAAELVEVQRKQAEE